MIQSINPSADQFLADLSRTQARIDRAEREISSGLKVASASDAPDEISGILQLHAEVGRNAQIRTNLNVVKSQVDAGEKALEAAVQAVDQARVLALQGSGTATSAETRLNLAQQVSAIQAQLLDLSRTPVEGQYIFSGDQDQSPAYDANPANPNGVDRLVTAGSTALVEHPSGIAFAASRTAQTIFDARNPDDSFATGNVFAAVNGLRVALEANDQTGIAASLASLSQGSDHLNAELSFYGVTQNRVSDALDTSNKLELQLKASLSVKEDADLTTSALVLTQSRTQQDAAFAERAKQPKTSLFDFLG